MQNTGPPSKNHMQSYLKSELCLQKVLTGGGGVNGNARSSYCLSEFCVLHVLVSMKENVNEGDIHL